MRVIETNVYKYEELSDSAKEAAREWYRERGWDWGGVDAADMTECFKDVLKDEYGIEDAELNWRLSYCQGDGVGITANIDVDKMAKHSKELASLMKRWSLFLSLNSVPLEDVYLHCKVDCGRNTFFTSGSVGVEYELSPEDMGYFGFLGSGKIEKADIEATLMELCDLIEDCVRGILSGAAKRLEEIGYKDIEYFSSDECVGEAIIASEWEFTEDGKPV